MYVPIAGGGGIFDRKRQEAVHGEGIPMLCGGLQISAAVFFWGNIKQTSEKEHPPRETGVIGCVEFLTKTVCARILRPGK